jgi:hypothetical protein
LKGREQQGTNATAWKTRSSGLGAHAVVRPLRLSRQATVLSPGCHVRTTDTLQCPAQGRHSVHCSVGGAPSELRHLPGAGLPRRPLQCSGRAFRILE